MEFRFIGSLVYLRRGSNGFASGVPWVQSPDKVSLTQNVHPNTAATHCDHPHNQISF